MASSIAAMPRVYNITEVEYTRPPHVNQKYQVADLDREDKAKIQGLFNRIIREVHPQAKQPGFSAQRITMTAEVKSDGVFEVAFIDDGAAQAQKVEVKERQPGYRSVQELMEAVRALYEKRQGGQPQTPSASEPVIGQETVDNTRAAATGKRKSPSRAPSPSHPASTAGMVISVSGDYVGEERRVGERAGRFERAAPPRPASTRHERKGPTRTASAGRRSRVGEVGRGLLMARVKRILRNVDETLDRNAQIAGVPRR